MDSNDYLTLSDIFGDDEEDVLEHYGTKYHSGRYPYGSGEDPYQHDGGIRGAYKDLKGKGLSDVDIAQGWGMTTTELRTRMSVEKTLERENLYLKCKELSDKGLNATEIGRKLGYPESSIRSFLDPAKRERNQVALATAEMLQKEVDTNGFTDIGDGMESRLGISRDKLKNATYILEQKGYNIYNIPVVQQGTNKKTTMQVIAPPDMTWKECLFNKDKVNVVNDPYTEDGGKSYQGLQKPVSVDGKRVLIRYAEEGGKDKDGLIEVRPNVEDLSMGDNRYCQARIAVNDKYYMKGMAIYNNNIPGGYDLVYNTNKSKGTPPEKVYKSMKTKKDENGNEVIDWDNPFGATIKWDEYEDGKLIREVGQRTYLDSNGKRKLGAINIVNEQGDWGDWSRRLSSQFLSKQSPALAERQLTISYEGKRRELEEIKALTNTEIQKRLLDSFADDCDSAVRHLKAAPVPGQSTAVIIPFPEMKDNECYAPQYPNGTIVSLVRHPHGGTFEIPTLVVNNNYRNARTALGNTSDAIGINAKVAAQLSGADFDGDTVLVLPNPNAKLIKSRPALEKLKDFEPKDFKKSDDMVPTGPRNKGGDGFRKQMQMGMVSNLITDMTLRGADDDELVRAIKHSMVIIDAEKHNLDWKASEKEYNTAELKCKYQDGGGVSTLISRAKHEVVIPERKDFYLSQINKDTGEIEWQETGRTMKKWNPETKSYEDTGKPATQKVAMIDTVPDAYELSSGTTMEATYADYANKLKALANDARKTRVSLKNMEYSPSAAKAYAQEVSSLKAKLNEAQKNRPLERKAQAIAESRLRELIDSNPDFDKADKKKYQARFLNEARRRMGSDRSKITFTPKEWEAVQAGAITSNLFSKLLTRTDIDVIKDYATPRNYVPKLSKSEIAYAKSMLAVGNYTTAQIASMLGVSSSTLLRAVE